MRVQVNAMGDTCPIPIVKTRNAIQSMTEAGEVEVLVDNLIAVQNLEKMARQKGYPFRYEKQEEDRYLAVLAISEAQTDAAGAQEEEEVVCAVPALEEKKESRKVVVISSDQMGNGSEELGAALMKAFLYALSVQEEAPKTILFYNGGARLTCEGSPALGDLQVMQEQGTEILTCGTCLDFYGLKDQLRIGGVTNMYAIVEQMMNATQLIRP